MEKPMIRNNISKGITADNSDFVRMVFFFLLSSKSNPASKTIKISPIEPIAGSKKSKFGMLILKKSTAYLIK